MRAPPWAGSLDPPYCGAGQHHTPTGIGRAGGGDGATPDGRGRGGGMGGGEDGKGRGRGGEEEGKGEEKKGGVEEGRWIGREGRGRERRGRDIKHFYNDNGDFHIHPLLTLSAHAQRGLCSCPACVFALICRLTHWNHKRDIPMGSSNTGMILKKVIFVKTFRSKVMA